MQRIRWVIAAVVLAGAIGTVAAAAGGNDWGTWTYSGHWTSWSGTFSDRHHVTGFVIGTRSRTKYNSVVSFTIGGKKCDISTSRGTAYCYYVDIPANTKLSWKLTTRKPVKSSAGLVPCIEYANRFHCRYGNN